MKVALVHDYIKEYGGAERVLEALHELYPDATVFTSVYMPEFLGPHRDRFKHWEIKTSWLQYVPLKHKLISPFRLLAPWIFQLFDFSSFDVVIVSATGAYFPNMIVTEIKADQKEKKTLHICYCHTPPRYLYGYATAREWKKHKLIAAAAGAANHVLRMVDFNASKNVDYYIANSQEIAGRIKKFYRRDATVIYPPVETQGLRVTTQRQEKKSYFLTGGRLARAKHVDIIVKACTELNVPLKVFGKGFAGYGEELKAIAGPTVEFVGEVDDKEKYKLMTDAKAFLFASEDEDFGIVPVESMACGTPVIAYKSGGVKETVVDGKTGLFFEELTVSSLVKSIKLFEKTKVNFEDCRKHAEKFSKERFQKEIKAFVDTHLK
jgi:glycosyltransferase involved in cell wall biosynthesis